MNAKELIRDTERLLLTQEHCTLAEATAPQLHNALSMGRYGSPDPHVGQVRTEAGGQASGLLPVCGIPDGPHGV